MQNTMILSTFATKNKNNENWHHSSNGKGVESAP